MQHPFDLDGSVLAGNALGFKKSVGNGGTVTQGTSKSTGVTLSRNTGKITMHNASLADATNVTFTLTNTKVAATDVVVVNVASGQATAGTYQVWANTVAAGSVKITVRNVSGGPLGEALVLNFVVIKGSSD